MKAVTSYNVSESSNVADLKMRLRSSVDYLCIGDIQGMYCVWILLIIIPIVLPANKTCWEKELTKEQRDRVSVYIIANGIYGGSHDCFIFF